MEVYHDVASRRFYVDLEGKRAYLEYVIESDALCVMHTIVPVGISGRGVAGALVSGAYDYSCAECLRFVPKCSYAKAWLERYLWTHGGM